MKDWSIEERYKKIENPDELIEQYNQVKKSKYKQKIHISPLTGLLNDPNGFTYYDGLWHLFYQWFPMGPVHGIKYWYHVISEDLVNWKNMGIALEPDTVYDDYGVHSGSSLVDNDQLYLCFTANHRDKDWNRLTSVMLAKLQKDKFVKQEIPLFGPNPNYTENQRDPNIFYDKEREKYFIFLGAQDKNNKPKILVYSTNSLDDKWEFNGELQVKGYEDFGEMWECPNYKNIYGKDVLIFSPQYLEISNRANMIHHNVYLTGELDLDKLSFNPDDKVKPLDYGFDFYAAQLNADSKDEKNYLIAWSGLPNDEALEGQMFDGSLTLPREVSIKNNKLYQRPVKGIESLRIEELKDNNLITIPSEILISKITGSFELRLFATKEFSGGLKLQYDNKKDHLVLDRSGLELKYNPENGEKVSIKDVKKITDLRVFIDSNTVEIFINNGEYSLTTRVFPSDKELYYSFNGNGNIKIYLLKESVDQSFII